MLNSHYRCCSSDYLLAQKKMSALQTSVLNVMLRVYPLIYDFKNEFN